MDNITHTLTGLMLSRAGLNRFYPRAAAILLLAANAPDIDVVSAIGGAANYLHYHRGITHSLVAVPFLAWLPVLLVRLVTGKSMAWKRAYGISLVGVASHLLMDWTNVYGVRLLKPFSDRWFNADITAIVDLWILAALLLGLIGPFISQLVSSEMGAKHGGGRGTAVVVLSLCLIYSFGRYLLHGRAVAVLDSRLYRNEAPLRVAALPAPANPFRWVGLVEGRNFYDVQPDVNLLDEFDPTAGRTFYKPDIRAQMEKAQATAPFRSFLEFSQWPLWRITPVAEPENGALVEVMDLRFGVPPQTRFVASAIVDGNLRVQQARFQFGGKSGYFTKTD